MKSKNIIFLAMFILGVSQLALISASSTGTCNPQISIINQNPYPAVPGEYVDVVFEVSGVSTSECSDGASFQLISAYPFSFDGNLSTKTITGNTWAGDYNSNWVIPFKLRVDEDAFDGDNQIDVKYSSSKLGDLYFSEKFNISVEDSRTSFDAVIQDYSSSEVSIALANIGKYTANSVVVRIPEQENFVVSGTDGQMVGNLDSGDYTIVGFTVTQKMTTSRDPTQGFDIQKSKDLNVDIYYTDNIGERRVVNILLPLTISTNSSMIGMGNGFNGTRNNSSPWHSLWVLWIIVALLAVGVYWGFKKGFFEALKNKFSKNQKSGSLGKIPEWANNAKRR